MGITSKLLITAILVVITGIIVHEYAPQYTTPLMKYPVIRETINVIQNLKNNLLAENEIKKSSNKPQEKLFTVEELKLYSGNEGDKGLYLAFLGVVYDVEKGRKFYGPGEGYAFFSGRDASRAFVTGEFNEDGLTDDISNLSSGDYLGIDEWVRFYNKDYTRVGKLIGRYYDENGSPTPYNKSARKWLKESLKQKEDEKQEKIDFPPCNSEWSPEEGSRVYCTEKSGGIERDWVGVPRKLFSLLGKKERCACVKNFGSATGNPSDDSNRGDLANPNLKEYPGCGPEEKSCKITEK